MNPAAPVPSRITSHLHSKLLSKSLYLFIQTGQVPCFTMEYLARISRCTSITVSRHFSMLFHLSKYPQVPSGILPREIFSPPFRIRNSESENVRYGNKAIVKDTFFAHNSSDPLNSLNRNFSDFRTNRLRSFRSLSCFRDFRCFRGFRCFRFFRCFRGFRCFRDLNTLTAMLRHVMIILPRL